MKFNVINLIYSVIIIICIHFCLLTNLSSTSVAELQEETVLEDTLLCRSCGTDTAVTNLIINKLSDKVLVASNETIFGKRKFQIQLIENSVGQRFEVVVLKQATCSKVISSTWKTSYTWFSGYSWKLCLCPRCSSHIGWMFEPENSANSSQILPSEAGFYVVDINAVIADSDLRAILETQYNKEEL